MLVEPSILHRHVLQRWNFKYSPSPPLITSCHSEAVAVTCHPMSILQVQKLVHRAGTPQKVHSYREKQKGIAVLSPQLKFKGLLQCMDFQSVLDKGGSLSLRSIFCPSGVGWVCLHVRACFSYIHKEQQMLYGIYTTFL